ncbi:MAG: DegQ family serine endoprotease [Anaeromyxobacter sp.]
MRLTKPLTVAALAGGLAIGGYAAGTRASSPAAAPPAPVAAATTPAPAPAAVPTAAVPDFRAIVREYGPAVVNVSVSGVQQTGFSGDMQGAPGVPGPDDPFFQFFRRFQPPQGEVPTRGIGSGFIVSPDGVILTNAHVVNGAREIRVKLSDRREFPAKVVGTDKETDVAVLRIDAKGLPAVRLGDPSRTQVGEWVLAIGSPFGFENTATAGIVSARARSLPDEGYVPFLQTDVAVNPGNSGGPLFNAAGEVIGINSQIFSRSGGYMGLSFAIPIDVAMRVEGQLLAHGKVTRGRLGVTIQDVDQALARSFSLPKPEGALVSSVEAGSPAAKAGVEPGDVILSLDGTPIATSNELPPRVADLGPGAKATLGVWRKGARRELAVTVGEAKGAAEVASAGAGEAHGKLGLSVRPLTPEERRQADLSGGVLVEGVSGPAARAGIQPGDVVLQVSGTPVTDVEQLRGLVSRAGDHLALLVQRGEARIFVPIALG